MLDMTTVNKLNDMRLTAMARAFSDQLSGSEYNGLSFEERVGLIVDTEWSRRKNKSTGAANEESRVNGELGLH